MISPGESIGPYRVLSALGAGGMGEVYLAEDTRLRRRVAIKVLPAHLLKDDERRRRFLREARAAAAVDHPNIIHIYEVMEDPGGGVSLVMQHVDGKTLRQTLESGKMDLDRALGVAMEIADALSAAHAQGIVHRDIKPDNVMLDGTGHARILDFGLARALEGPETAAGATAMETAERNVTASGAVMGTVAYMSPEQARGMGVDARSDIFSFGVTLYQMVTGRHPFTGRTTIETIDSLLNHEPKPISEILPGAPPAMEWVLSKMLAKDRDERYQSAKEVLADLRKLRHSTSGATGIVPPRPGKKISVPLLVGSVVALAAFIAIPMYLSRASRSAAGFPAPPIPGVPPPPGAAPAGSIPAVATMKIAVLPLQNVRKDPRIDFLGFALADALISKLSYVNSVIVRPSSYVQRYRDAAPDPKQVGADLGVDHLLIGTLLAEGNTLRISIQLVDLASDTISWQDLFDARLDNLLGVQDEIVNRLVEGMKVRLTPAESSRLQRDVPRNREAYDLLLRAKALPATVEGTRKSIELLQQSLKLDPSFAPTWGELGQNQYTLSEYMNGTPEDYEAASQSFRRALDLNPDLPDAFFSYGIHLVETGQHEEAYRRFRKHLDANPGDAGGHFVLSYLYRYTGMLREAAGEAEKALALDPANGQFRSGARIYLYLGEVDRAERFLALDKDSVWSAFNRMEGALLTGDFAKARVWGEKCAAADPKSSLALSARGAILIMDGDRAGALRVLRPLFGGGLPDSEQRYSASTRLAWAGDLDAALDLLSRAVKGGFFSHTALEDDDRVKELRARPEYAAIRDEARRRSEAFRAFVAANP